MDCLVEVGLDNNAICNWLTREGVEGVAARARRQRMRLVISDMVLTETARGSDEATTRLVQLGELAHALGDGLRMAATVGDQLLSERAGYRRRVTPFSRPNPLLRLRDMTREEIAEWRAEARGELRKFTGQDWWTFMLATAQTTATPALRAQAVSFLAGLPETIRAQFREDGWMIDHAVPLERRGDGLGMRRRVTSDPWAFSAHAAWHGMFIAAAIAGGLASDPDARSRSRWTVAMRTHKNDWADTQVVAGCSRCAFLVTDDKAVVARLKLLAEAGMTFVVPVSLSDVL